MQQPFNFWPYIAPSALPNLHTPHPATAASMEWALARDGVNWKAILQATESLGLFGMDSIIHEG